MTQPEDYATNGRVCLMLMHYLVADDSSPAPIRHFTDEHVLDLHTEEDYQAAMVAAGLTDITKVDGWASGRLRLIATRSPAGQTVNRASS